MLPPRPPRDKVHLKPQPKDIVCSSKLISLGQKLSTSESSDSEKYVARKESILSRSIEQNRPLSNSSSRSTSRKRGHLLPIVNRSNSKQRVRERRSKSSYAPLFITSKNWGLFEMKKGSYITGHRADSRRQFASLTKIMNFVTILEIVTQMGIDSSDLYLPVGERASKIIGTTANLKVGEILCLRDLYYGMMLPSGNDAAYQTAMIGGALLKLKEAAIKATGWNIASAMNNEKQCVQRYLIEMNRIANRLNMKRTKWSNPHGLSNIENFTTVHDLFELCSYAMSNSTFRQVVSTQSYICVAEKYEQEANCVNDEPTKRVLQWQNTNKMLQKNWSGIKTGITPNAGPCLAASVSRIIEGEQLEFLVILGGCKSMEQRWVEVEALVDWTVSNRLA